MAFPTFSVWAAMYGKVYNGEQAAAREVIYNGNVLKIQAHNQMGHSWTMNINEC